MANSLIQWSGVLIPAAVDQSFTLECGISYNPVSVKMKRTRILGPAKVSEMPAYS
jgi:hypothetical protein